MKAMSAVPQTVKDTLDGVMGSEEPVLLKVKKTCGRVSEEWFGLQDGSEAYRSLLRTLALGLSKPIWLSLSTSFGLLLDCKPVMAISWINQSQLGSVYVVLIVSICACHVSCKPLWLPIRIDQLMIR